jgi:hypothetical protein
VRPILIAGILAVCVTAPAALAQGPAEQRPVTRPDGSVVPPYVDPNATPRSTMHDAENKARAEERERQVLENLKAREARIEQERRAREAAQQNPARQVKPSSGQ